ncbi:unnamed protein product [Nyctereutes procyonoides]|uniref:(raccoon dog) hypothetical protein n=1 Tax=Nyctereutes procyonoides TaxID=34880 RepID=A0A811YFN3_NYCPR|nr:unnamed protein product [Nyctereutes procyonoides]
MAQEEELLRIVRKLEEMLLQTTSIGVAINGVCKSCSDKKVMSLAKGEKGEEGDKAKKEKGLTIQTGWKPEVDRRDSMDPSSLATFFQKGQDPKRSNSSKSKAGTPKAPKGLLTPSLPPLLLLVTYYLTGDSVGQDYRINFDKMTSEIEDRPRDPGLRRNVFSGAISAGLIAKMMAEGMARDELRELRNAITQEAIYELQMSKTGGTTTDLFHADEPMTTLVLCNECGNHWNFC